MSQLGSGRERVCVAVIIYIVVCFISTLLPCKIAHTVHANACGVFFPFSKLRALLRGIAFPGVVSQNPYLYLFWGRIDRKGSK